MRLFSTWFQFDLVLFAFFANALGIFCTYQQTFFSERVSIGRRAVARWRNTVFTAGNIRKQCHTYLQQFATDVGLLFARVFFFSACALTRFTP